jgi:hypothetical protein
MIQLYTIKIIKYFQLACGLLRVLWFPPPIKLTTLNITEIWLIQSNHVLIMTFLNPLL